MSSTQNELQRSPITETQEQQFINLLVKRGRKEMSGVITVTHRQLLAAAKAADISEYRAVRFDDSTGVITTLIQGHQYIVQPRG
jgi:hypothetical protein